VGDLLLVVQSVAPLRSLLLVSAVGDLDKVCAQQGLAFELWLHLAQRPV
jgi:hypothetical protein